MEEGSLRLLIVSNLYPPQVVGGAEVVAERQARLLAARGHHVAVLSGWSPGPMDAEAAATMEKRGGIHVYRIPIASFDQAHDFFSKPTEAFLESVVRVERPAIVHMHNLRGLGVNLIAAAQQCGARVVVTLHDLWGHCYWATRLRPDGSLCSDPEMCGEVCVPMIEPSEGGRPALPVRLRRDYIMGALDRADQLISPSVSLAVAYQQVGMDPDHLVVLSNRIDLAPFLNIGPKPVPSKLVRFATAATLAEHKGIPDLLDAAAILWSDATLRGHWQLTIAGDGPLRGEIEADIAAGQFGNAVVYVGHLPRSGIVELFAKTDVVVLPSRWPENEPLVLLEAMAAGSAQLASDVGGNRELVVPGISGGLFRRADSVALAGAMTAYIRAPSIAHAHGTFNIARRKLFDETVTIDAIEGYYRTLLQRPIATETTTPIVICGGGAPSSGVKTLCCHLHKMEKTERHIRLLWSAWADASQWQKAALFWHWGCQNEDLSSVEHALLEGLPILAQVHSRAAGQRGAIVYRTILEAAIALTWLPHETATLAKLTLSAKLRLQRMWLMRTKIEARELSGNPEENSVDTVAAAVVNRLRSEAVLLRAKEPLVAGIFDNDGTL